jgi:hypothetical protein
MSTAEFSQNAALLQELLTGQQELKEAVAKLTGLVTLLGSQAQSKPPTQRAKKPVNLDVSPTVAVDITDVAPATSASADAEEKEAPKAKKPRAPAKPKSVSKPAYITANWSRNQILNDRIQKSLTPEQYAEVIAKEATDAEKGAILAKLFPPKKQIEILADIDLNAL